MVTSANPTGEADTTHHNQVYAKLGDKVIGALSLFVPAGPKKWRDAFPVGKSIDDIINLGKCLFKKISLTLHMLVS